jgi:hypothetical protein
MFFEHLIVGPDGVTVVMNGKESFSWSELLWFDYKPVGTDRWRVTLVPRVGDTIEVPVPHPNGTSKHTEDELWRRAVQLTQALLGDDAVAKRAVAEREGWSSSNTPKVKKKHWWGKGRPKSAEGEDAVPPGWVKDDKSS